MIAGPRGADRRHHRDRDREVNDVEAKDRERRHGLPEPMRLYPHMTVRKERGVPAQDPPGPDGRAKPPRRGDDEDARARDDCWSESRRSSREVSASGWHSRRAIVRRPQAFLMDEPLSNLDAKLRVQTRGRARRAATTAGGDDRVRDSRPGRGDDDGGPHRHSRPWRAPAGGTPPRTCTRARRTSSWRASSVTRR